MDNIGRGGGGGGRGAGRFARAPLTEAEKAAASKITKKLIFRAFSYLKPYKPQLAVIMVCLVVSSAFALLPTMISGEIINVFSDENAVGVTQAMGGGLRRILVLIGFSLGVLAISNLIGVAQSYVSAWMSQHIMKDMRDQMYAHLQKMSQRFYTTEKPGDILTRMTSDISGVNQVISGTLQQIFSNIITLIVTISALLTQNWVLALVGVAITPLLIIPTRIVGQKRFDLARSQQEKNDEMNQILNETLSVSGSLLMKIFTAEKREYERFQSVNSQAARMAIKESIVGRWLMMAFGVLQSLGPVLIYLSAALMMFLLDPKDVIDPVSHATIAVNGMRDLNVGTITVITGLMARLMMPVSSLFSMQIDVTRSMALFDRLFEYFDMPVEVGDSPGAVSVPSVEGRLDFDDVSFSYDPASPVLEHLTFSVEPGTSLALVGPSGAGKSSLANLIPRLYDVTGGSVRIDGTDVRDMRLTDLRSHVALVTQDTYLFNGTLMENLLYAKPQASADEIEDACRKANIHDFIVSLPDGYLTVVGNRGLKLSGGEKQRVSIARAILKNPSVLILDEATSSLDSVSESLIQEAIVPLLRNRTSVVIAHRLSTVMEADEIIVLKDGKIDSKGKHRELLAASGLYRELYETQFQKVIDEYASSLQDSESRNAQDDA